jgi:hypothetical protein
LKAVCFIPINYSEYSYIRTKMAMKHLFQLVVTALLSGTCSGTSYQRPLLRAEQEAGPEDKGKVPLSFDNKIFSGGDRFLQLDTLVLNGLIDLFIPSLSEQVQDQIASLDPLIINWNTSASQGQLPLNVNGTFCNATSAQTVATYSFGSISGLSTVDVTKLQLEGNTADIYVPPLAILGFQEEKSTWEGTWRLEADFDSFTGATVATLAKTFCNFTFEESRNGTSTIVAPTLAMTMRLKGETTDIYDVKATSQVNSATIETFNIGYNAIVPKLGIWKDWVTLDANPPLINLGNNGLSGELKILLRDQIQVEIDKSMPYGLDR